MRILRVHNYYQQRGGEDVSFEAEASVLRQQGEDVSVLEFSNDDIESHRNPLSSLQLAASTVWSRTGQLRVANKIDGFQPDVVHFDNTFPLISPSVYSAAKRQGITVVQSLRNYRLLCPSANFFREGHACEDCLGKTPPLPGVIHGCYHDSAIQSAVIATMLTVHRVRGTWKNEVDQYIALTEFARNKFIQGGFPQERLTVKPNFVDIPAVPSVAQRKGMVFVGRLTMEKGVLTLLRAMSSAEGIHLLIIGDGPLQKDVLSSADQDNLITYLGRKSEAETYDLMGQAQAVIVPSEWYEPFGRVAVEAFAHATPVIATRSGGLAELVDDTETGLLFESGNADDLAAKVQWAADHPEEMRRMGVNARREYEAKYTPERNYEMLMDIYEQAIHHAKNK